MLVENLEPAQHGGEVGALRADRQPYPPPTYCGPPGKVIILICKLEIKR